MTNMITQNAPSLQDHIKGFKTLHPRISYADIAKEAGVSIQAVYNAKDSKTKPHRQTRLAIENALIRLAEREVAKKAFCDGANAAHHALVDDQIESAGSREKAELQKALAERVDQVAALQHEINRIEEILERSNAQNQATFADLTKANKRIACQSENIEALQQQLSAERVSYNDKIERLQSDFDLMQHEYTKAQKTITNKDSFIETLHQDKIDLSDKSDRLQSRAEIFKITAFICGALWLVTLFCLIVILVG